MFLPGFEEAAFDAGERPASDADGSAGREKRPGLGGETGIHDSVDGLDFAIVDGVRGAADAEYVENAGGGYYEGAADIGIETYEQVPGEEGEFEIGDAIAPLPSCAIEGKKLAEAFDAEGSGGGFLVVRPDGDGEPAFAGSAA